MADAVQAAPWTVEGLSDSAPLRDRVRTRPQAQAPQSFAVDLPPGGMAAPTRAQAVAAVVVLLAKHSRRERVELVLRSAADMASLWPLSLAIVPGQMASALVLEVVRQCRAATLGAVAPALPEQVDAAQIPGVLFEWCPQPQDSHPMPLFGADLVFRFQHSDVGLRAQLIGNTSLYLAHNLAALARQASCALAWLMAAPDQPLADVVLQDDAELRRLLRDFNGPRLRFPVTQTLAGLIDAQAARLPTTICAVHGERTLSYAELDRTANRMAHLLIDLGVGPGQFVAIVDARGIDFLVAMLAIWKAGAAYIPVDPGYPAERVRYMLQDSEARVAVFGANAIERGLGSDVPTLQHIICAQPPASVATPQATVHGQAALAAQSENALPPRATHRDPAYMVYTSGSTGRPKGAIVRHDGAINHVYAQAHALGEDGIRRFLQSAPSSSDISVWQFAAPLAFGGVTVIIDDVTDVQQVLHTMRAQRISIIELVPVVLKYFIEYALTLPVAARALPDLRWAMVTGEAPSVELVNAWLRTWPDIPIVNAYGPTEAADDVVQAILREPLPSQTLNVPTGQPLANMDVYLLDEQHRLVPIGAPGEIYIAGVGVGAGYWKQPEKTAHSFITNPFAAMPGTAGPLVYRSGDLGRWHADGTLECLGRNDHQVQLRGFRIELQEIESVLRGHLAISDTVVHAFHDGQGDGQLVAYVVPRAGQQASDTELRAHLAASLAPYMVPAHIVPLERLPLNPAGKVDRRALPSPGAAALAATEAGPGGKPRNAVEAALVQIWREEFSLPQLNIYDDFFALGGDSLHALGIVVGARAAGLVLRSADVLEQPSVAQLATVARNLAPDLDGHPARAAPGPRLSAITPLPQHEVEEFLAREPAYESVRPLSPSQRALFVHWMLSRDKSAYVDQYAFELEGPLDVDAFRAAWQQVVRRHSTLRTAFLRSVLSQPVQAARREVDVDVTLFDAEALSAAELQALAQAEVSCGFTLAQPAQMRLLLLRLGAKQHRLLWTHHHIVLDGWSMGLLMQEVLALHQSLSLGGSVALPAPAETARYSEWLDRLDISGSEAYWSELLRGRGAAPRWRVPAPDPASSGYGQCDVELSANSSAALALQARRQGLTLTTLLQAAWGCTVAHLTGRDDVLFGVVSSGREIALPGIATMVGLFVTTLPMRFAVQAERATRDWLAGLQTHATDLRRHEHVPLSQIGRWSDVPTGQAMFETLFVMSNYPGLQAKPDAALCVRPGEFRTVPAYPLSLIVTPGDRLALRLVHERRRLDAASAAKLAALLMQLLEHMARGDDPRQAVAAG